MKEKLLELSRKRRDLEAKLVGPARAAANAMKDAGMNRTADPLLEILFQIDANESEIQSTFSSDPEKGIEALISMLGPKS